MLKDLFGGKSKYVTVERKNRSEEKKNEHKGDSDKKEMPDDLWTKCKSCKQIIFNKKLAQSLKICPECGSYFRLTATERLFLLTDDDKFEEYDAELQVENPLDFPDYKEKIDKYQEQTGLKEAVITGIGEINGWQTSLAVIDSRFLMGSMNSVVGEKITRAIERALQKGLPLVIVSGGGGGARMYEGMLSLMQMAKTSAALKKLDQAGGLFISVLTDPTYGGISASFASLGDINLAEPQAKIGFAGPRVIKQTINRDLPDGFQTSEFLLEHGMIDKVVERADLKNVITRIIDIHSLRGEKKNGTK
ncbi:acetyl-CoA carboxylase, carboxyltransferase subunit beta [Natroniella sp. ANB-PHB2]|uniref:acetyl-CoA carboxylase, carboxyltransferase subunit beta n=1 Tax=Natroniella sp. ANB-PHB2 TaxID=3384444 RepID=UPI0038D3BDC6